MNRELFSGINMSIEDILKAGGLPEKGRNLDLKAHLDGSSDSNSAFRGATVLADARWAGENGTVVRIDANKVASYDSNSLTRDAIINFDGTRGNHIWSGESEFTVHAKIPLSSIKQFGMVSLNPRTEIPYVSKWIDNIYYKKK